ncbi:unnamed protein product [Staurois parvus]|uniref:Uncharacterized protein n=1 Tax=Staurois parvus TaxID=386267 RepID=A0ABN9AK50_9NEOB|nr:unnamed protein product [Staurois parvus]
MWPDSCLLPSIPGVLEVLCSVGMVICLQGRTDHLETRALPEGPGSVGGPMRCPWYLFHRIF